MVKIKLFSRDEYSKNSDFEWSINNFLKNLKEDDIGDIKSYGMDNRSIMIIYKEEK